MYREPESDVLKLDQPSMDGTLLESTSKDESKMPDIKHYRQIPAYDPVEDPNDRAARHAMQGRVDYATLDITDKISQDLASVKADVSSLKNDLTGKVDRLLDLLGGKMDDKGELSDGIIRKVTRLNKFYLWVMGIGGVLATGELINVLHNVFGLTITHAGG